MGASIISLKSLREDLEGSLTTYRQSEVISPDDGIVNLAFENGPSDSVGNMSTSKKVVPPENTGIFKEYGGIALTLFASITLSFGSLLVKVLHKDYNLPPEASGFWRYTGMVIISLPMLLYHQCCAPKDSMKHGSVFHDILPVRENWRSLVALLFRGIFGASGIILLYTSLAYLTIGDATVIACSSPILVIIIAHFVLGEKAGMVPFFSTLVALVGVVTIAQPPILTGKSSFSANQLTGSCIALASLVCLAMMVILARRIREVHYMTVMVVIGLTGMTESLAFMLLKDGFKVTRELQDTLLLFGLVLLSFCGQLGIILGLKFEQAGAVALTRTCDAVFGFLFQFLFLGVVPDKYSAIGGSLVLFGILIISLRKYVSTLPTESRCRRFFCCLLY